VTVTQESLRGVLAVASGGMPLVQTVFLVVSAFAAGVVDAIAGGGGLITLPVLLAVGLPPEIAIPTNKGQATFGAVASFVSYWRGGTIDRERAPVGFGFGLLGSFAGAAALLALRPALLRPIVVVLLLFAALVVLLRGHVQSKPRHLAAPLLTLAPLAFALGAYDGFFGPGVGSLLIVAFVLVFGDTFTRASANAKVVNLASNIAALALFASRGAVLWTIAVPMGIANAMGAAFGARFVIARGDRVVRVVVLVVVCAVVVKVSLDMLRGR
jgi:uncharacterized membrane protein YfcA